MFYHWVFCSLQGIGDMTLAYQAFRLTLANNNDHAEAYNNLGVLELRKGHVEMVSDWCTIQYQDKPCLGIIFRNSYIFLNFIGMYNLQKSVQCTQYVQCIEYISTFKLILVVLGKYQTRCLILLSIVQKQNWKNEQLKNWKCNNTEGEFCKWFLN